MTHELKTWPEYFRPVARGEKNFEVRRNDRDFQVGDVLTLRKFNPKIGVYTSAECDKSVTFILHGKGFGVAEGYCVLALGDVEE